MASSGMITLAIPYLFARHVHLQGIQHTPLGCVFPVVFPRSLDTLLPHVAIPPQHTHTLTRSRTSLTHTQPHFSTYLSLTYSEHCSEPTVHYDGSRLRPGWRDDADA